MSPREPSNHDILSGFLDFSSHQNLRRQHHKSTSPLGVLGQKEGPTVSPKEPSNHKIVSGFFDVAKALNFIRPTHTSTSFLLFLDTKKAPRRPRYISKGTLRSQEPLNAFGCCLRMLFYETCFYISISTRCSWPLNLGQKVCRESQSIGKVICVLGSVAGSGAHAPFRYK